MDSEQSVHYSSTVAPCYSATPPPNPKLSPLPVPPPLVVAHQKNREGGGEGEGEGEKRREGRLGHAAIRRCCSPKKTGRISSPLSVFPHLHGFSSLFMVVPPCVLQFGGNRRVTMTLTAKKTVWNRCLDRRRHL